MWDLHWNGQVIPHVGNGRSKGLDSGEEATRRFQEWVTGLRCDGVDEDVTYSKQRGNQVSPWETGPLRYFPTETLLFYFVF